MAVAQDVTRVYACTLLSIFEKKKAIADPASVIRKGGDVTGAQGAMFTA